MKAGTVAFIGRPNVGKSTLLNTIIGQKVAITSPKPQTTRFPIEAIYEDKRGQIIFVDTPGIFNKVHDNLAKKINQKAGQAMTEELDAVIYVVDPTRKRDFEEAKVLGIVRKIDKPKILVYNKSDLEQEYLPLYRFMEEEFPQIFTVSALKRHGIAPLITALFELIPERTPEHYEGHPHPGINIDSTIFLSELIREKIFLKMRKEVPYTTMVLVDEIADRDNGVMYIKARILTTDDKYKKMIIGEHGKSIKLIGSMARKELELATSRKVYLDITVETDRHWVETMV